MNIQRFRHFVAVAELKNFGRAAERLGIRQPPLSQSIQRLERDLGVALFTRTTQHVRLTLAGAALLPEASAAIDAAERGIAGARAALTKDAPVRVGVVSLALFEILPAFLKAAEQAGTTVQLVYASTNEQLRLLATGALDFGFLSPPFEKTPRMTVIGLSNEPALAGLPVSQIYPAAKNVPLEAISDRLIMFRREDGPHLYDMTLALFRREGLSPKIVEETPSSILATLALIAAGRGVALVPASIARNVSVAGVTFKPIKPATAVPTWPTALAHMPLPARSPAGRTLSLGDRDNAVAETPGEFACEPRKSVGDCPRCLSPPRCWRSACLDNADDSTTRPVIRDDRASPASARRKNGTKQVVPITVHTRRIRRIVEDFFGAAIATVSFIADPCAGNAFDYTYTCV
jgi:DNA-binding transcriptional LysR family regulator